MKKEAEGPAKISLSEKYCAEWVFFFTTKF